MKPRKSNDPAQEPAGPTHEQISERARSIWHQQGQPEGRDLDHWLEAERQLRETSGSSRASASNPLPGKTIAAQRNAGRGH